MIMASVRVVILIMLIVNMASGFYAINGEEYQIISDTLPTDDRFRPPIGNGHIATNVLTDAVYMNGLYNGREDSSSRARIPAYVAVDVDVTRDVTLREKYILDMYNGVFIKHTVTSNLDVSFTQFAHRSLYHLIVTQIRVTRTNDQKGNVTLKLSGKYGKMSSDLKWQHRQLNGSETRDRKTMYHFGQIREPELPNYTPTKLHVYNTIVPDRIILPPGKESLTLTYIASHGIDKTKTLHAYQNALRLGDNLLATHKQVWNKLWDESRIDIDGNKQLSTDIAAAFYNILCSLPTQDNLDTPFYGLGPGGLSRGGLLYPEKPGGGSNDYAGHVFWDMDTWVMPPVMMFHPAMARRMLGARTRVLDQAKANAKVEGFKGVKFPWEQAATGIEVTPRWAGNMSRYEIHVTADISYGLRQYLYAVDDIKMITTGRGFEMAIEIARFWQSRVTKTGNNTVEILGVMGPDEYHFNVNNSVFTNYNAKLSLQLPRFIIERYNISINASIDQEVKDFESTADKILILFDENLQYHPQYEHFNLSGSIKQSDVVLLGYPLMMPMNRTVRRNDLEMYEKITNAQGPDTGTWSMHTVGWLELGDEDRAYRNFQMMFRNVNEPFKVFSEKPVTNTSYGGCVNFITGAGGLLQSIIFGYGGIRLRADRMEINSTPIPNTNSWSLKGIHYKGINFDVQINNESILVSAGNIPLQSKVTITGTTFGRREFRMHDTFKFKRQEVSLQVNEAYVKQSFISTSSPKQSSTTVSGCSDFNSHLHCALVLILLLLFVTFQ